MVREGLEIGPRRHQVKTVDHVFSGEIHLSLSDFRVYFKEVDNEIEINTAILFLGIDPPKKHEIETTVNQLIKLIEKEVGALRVKIVVPHDRD